LSSSRSVHCCKRRKSSVQTWRAARKADKAITETDIRGALLEFEPIWNELFPAEQARIVELLVERVDLQPDGIDLCLRIEGLTSLCSELRASNGTQQEAA
jgi:site-specific DNA recombinase